MRHRLIGEPCALLKPRPRRAGSPSLRAQSCPLTPRWPVRLPPITSSPGGFG